MKSKRFRIAFSFAGENRDFVAKVATTLAMRFGEGAILYDKFHMAEFARDDLSTHLMRLYRDESALIVVVLAPEYETKEWCGLEWRTIRGLLKQRHADEIMLTRFKNVEPETLEGLAGYIDLDYETTESVAGLILERLALNEGKPRDFYKQDTTLAIKRFPASVPNNLPRLQPFFGRRAELMTIREALEPESPSWGIVIDGPGGIGKTSLAVRAAYDCPTGQFQRIIFVSVKDREMDDDGERCLGPLLVPGFLEMLNEIARELDQAHIAKAAENQRIRLVLDALRSARALLILDNLESLPKPDRDQLFAFVSRLPPDCKAILTSRRRIGSGAMELILKQLNQSPALETLADLAKRNELLASTSESERIALYRETGGNPLLLRWVAGQLGRGSCRTFSDALAHLRACPEGNDALEFIFGDLVQRVSASETAILAILTHAAQPLSVQAIADITGFAPDQCRTSLKLITNDSLVVHDQEEKRYTLMPMVADFLCRHRQEVVRESGTRLERHAYALVVENGYRKHDLFAVLDADWPTIASAMPLFLAGPSPRLQTVCDALQHFLHFSGRWDESLSLSQQAESKAVQDGDYANAGRRAHQAGYIHYLRGEGGAVLSCADRATMYWETSEVGERERASVSRLRSLGHRLNKEYPAAINAGREAIELLRNLWTESMEMAVALNSLADAEHRSGDFAAADGNYREALRLARIAGDPEGEAIYTGNLAELMIDREDLEEALNLAREALNLSEKLGRLEVIASNCRRLAQALVRQGHGTEATSYARRAVEIYSKLGSPRLATAQATLAECEG